ncbi:helix-turn-helix domain-containing protein [Bacillus mangrovi]|uniref:Helix-turn-helix domain-containing protein n=1 Tax=Metabacillus mangrovi TaxID=1491830 RepID=A0A7X2S8J5_9BACI|nr:AraC family transcriptional regulator [Metabacillus mangrovi]MTH55599.1 helix-turn-helix domain-containing protein [Metabacillus mangrovi]
MPDIQHGAVAFRFKEEPLNQLAQLWSVGWEEQTSSIYSWSGTERKDLGKVIFQVTLSGFGEIDIDGKVHRIQPGHAFIVKSPSQYRYYLPEASEKWEFMYVTIYGKEADRCFEHIQSNTNQVIRFHPESVPVKLVKQIYDEANSKNITSAYKGSSLAYQFIMELYEYVSALDKEMDEWPESIVSAVLFARQSYQNPIGPDEMADASGLSRYHFTRIFKKNTGMTPIQYLTRIRISKAIELLEHTKYTTEEIASLVGYTNANYLNKVCRKVTGKSPGELRRKKSGWQWDRPELLDR